MKAATIVSILLHYEEFELIILKVVGGCVRYDDSCTGSSFNLDMDCIYHKICHCLESSKLVQEAYDYTYYFYSFTIEFSILSGKLKML